jgi:hypothetical protein
MCAPGPFVLRSITLLRLLLAALALVDPIFTGSTEKLHWQTSAPVLVSFWGSRWEHAQKTLNRVQERRLAARLKRSLL